MKKELLIKLARASIAKAVGIAYEADMDALIEQNPWLREQGASFVTLTIGGHKQLRGCIGSIIAHRPLYEDIIGNSRAAALDDPRFMPLGADEFDRISVEVSILTPPKEVKYDTVDELKSKITAGADGVILRYGHHQATYLPQVWEQLPDFESFFANLCAKAGMSMGCLSLHPQIFVYRVEAYEEE